MTFLLNSQNVFDYLVEQGFCTQSEESLSQVEPIAAKNFNLLLSLSDGRKLLIKQERYDREGKTAGDFLREWRIQEFLQRFPELSHIRPWMPMVLHFDAEHSIIVFSYLDDYRDLADYYSKENVFPTQIGEAIATLYAENKSHFQKQVPLFTKLLAPGIGLAEHPTSELKFGLQQQFGENRCEIVANALLEAHQNGDKSPEARMKYIIQHFERLGLDPERPYLNPDSEDIYTPLD